MKRSVIRRLHSTGPVIAVYMDLYEFSPADFVTLDAHGKIVESILRGIESVLAGRQPGFATKYACRSPTDNAGFSCA